MKINGLTLVLLIAIVALGIWFYRKDKQAPAAPGEDYYQDPFGAMGGGGGGYPLGVAPVTRTIESGDPYIAGVPSTIIFNNPDTVDVPLSMQQPLAQVNPQDAMGPVEPEPEKVQAIDLSSPTQDIISANPPASPSEGIYVPNAVDPTLKTLVQANTTTQPIEETFKQAEFVLQN